LLIFHVIIVIIHNEAGDCPLLCLVNGSWIGIGLGGRFWSVSRLSWIFITEAEGRVVVVVFIIFLVVQQWLIAVLETVRGIVVARAR
jgi:hypothetical protein